MKIANLVLWGLMISSTSFAQQNPLCDDMLRYVCAPGYHDDGTGSLRRGESWSELIYKAYKQYEPKIQSQIADVLSRPENSEFRNLAMITFGMKDAPECRSASAVDIGSCNKAVAEGVSSVMKDEITGVESRPLFMGSAESAEERRALTRNRVYQDTLLSLQKTYLGISANPTTEKIVRETMFPKIKNLLMQKIKKIPMDEKQRALMLTKLGEIRYAGSDCDQFAHGLARDYMDGAYYLPATKKFVICAGNLGRDFSEFKIARIMAHELSHSIDPCNNAAEAGGLGPSFATARELSAQEREYPIQGLISCLRSDKSVQAFRAPVSTKKDRPLKYSFCRGDQITESTADWFGVEIMAEYIAQNHPQLSAAQWQIGIANSVRHSCDTYEELQRTGDSTFDEHLRLPIKLNALLLTQPKIREKMGCTASSPKYFYCDVENPALLQKRFPNSLPGATPSDVPKKASKKKKK